MRILSETLYKAVVEALVRGGFDELLPEESRELSERLQLLPEEPPAPPEPSPP